MMVAETHIKGRGFRSWFARTRRALTAPREPEPARRDPGAEGRLEDLAPAFEAAPDPVLLVDAAGRIAAANAPARRRWHVAAGMRLSAVLRHPPLLDAAHLTASDRTVRTAEFVNTGSAEEHFHCTIAPLAWRGQVGALMSFRDRTHEIAAERTRVDFVANASHELRTPLTALSMLIETIAGPARDSDADRARFLAMMQTQADRMRRLIDDLLALSRIELDEHVPPSDSVDLHAAAREAADSAAPVAALRNVHIEIATSGETGAVVGDRFQIAQVVQNLIDNAVKYSAEGGLVRVELAPARDRDEAIAKGARRWAGAGRVSMLTPPPAPGRAYAYLRVEDSGAGIPMRFLPRLGERFYRVEREVGADRGGTGLGLAIVKHIVSRCRGGLAVESEPGRGSAFTVYFERVAAPDPAPPEA